MMTFFSLRQIYRANDSQNSSQILGQAAGAAGAAGAVDNDDGIYAQLLEQATDLHNELCRENSELRREVRTS